MPYSKSYASKGGKFGIRKRKRKHFISRYGPSAMKYSLQALKIARQVKSLVNVEYKYKDSAADVTPSTTEAFVLLNGLALGDTSETREGQSILMKNMLVRFQLVLNASASVTATRVIIVIDKQSNAAAPTAAQILDVTGSMISPLNIDYGSRFVVLLDKLFALDNVGKKIIEFKRFMKLNAHAKYNTANNGTVADITTNSLYMMHYSSEATNTPTLSYNIRLRFIDN